MKINLLGIGEIITYCRKTKNLSQSALADGICTKEYIYKLEKGKCSPTLYLLDQISNRLGINLYDQYAIIYRQGGLENHKLISQLNECFVREKLEQLPLIFDKCEHLRNKMEGELFQVYLYGKALYSSYILNEIDQAIEYEVEGINIICTNYNSSLDLTHLKLTNISLALIQTLAVDLASVSRKKEGFSYLIQLHQYLNVLLETNDYVINRNHNFETKLYCSVIHNLIVYNTNYYTYQELDQLCRKGLDTLKRYNLSFVFPELLFDQCNICCHLSKEEEANKFYLMAQQMGDFYYNEDMRRNLECNLLDDKL